MKREVIATQKAPAAIGPYSQGIRLGNLLFTAGQLALDPQTGEMIKGDITAQTRQVLKNIKAIVETGGSSMENVLKTTIFLVDFKDYKEMNAVYTEFFGKEAPARSTVQVASLVLGARVEIDAIAWVSD
jgi:2-iminobutanoate/2-iminopropanoate deaminase